MFDNPTTPDDSTSILPFDLEIYIPVNAGKTLGKGLLRKILRDAELTRDEFIILLG